LGNRSILIVDDDQMNVQLVRVLLLGDGYDLRAAFDATEALDVLAAFRPGLILMDVQLPRKSGLELARELRANPEMNRSSIVALTAYGGKDDEQRCLNAGCDGFIVKPVDTSMFPSIIRSFIDNSARAVPKVYGDVRDLLRGLRNSFINESLADITELLSTEFQTHKNRLLRTLDHWGGIAGILGMPSVAEHALKTEWLVESDEEMVIPAVRDSLKELQRLITAAASAPAFELALPSEIVKTLSGKRIGLTGFSEPEARRISQVLDHAEGFTLCIETPPEGLSAAVIERFDLVILNLVTMARAAYQDHTRKGLDKPLLLVSSRACISAKGVLITPARDFLAAPWDSEELLARCCRLLSSDSRLHVEAARRKRLRGGPPETRK
jgi:two-component system cell cycle response regulator DivK